MKSFLAVDTSGSYLSVVIGRKDGQIVSVGKADCGMKQSLLLMEAVDEALQKAQMQLSDCDFFASVVGAGSFTGIRIGISAVKGFCLACNKPALAVTSFELSAYNALGERAKEKMLCLVDAMHDCYYACGYENGEVAIPPAYLTEEEVLALEAQGYSLRACSPLPIGEKATLTELDPLTGLKNACLRADEKNFGELEALYVRKSSAELNLQK